MTQDFRTILDSDGTGVGRLSIHAGFYITYNALDEDFSPDPKEIPDELE